MMSDTTSDDRRDDKRQPSWQIGPISRLGFMWAVLAFVIDQAHKTFMLNVIGMTEGDRFTLLPFFDIVLIWNRGVSYGLLQQHDLMGRLLLAGFSLAAIAALSVWLMRGRHSPFAAIAIGLVIGGALGNVVDRLIRPGVADFFSLHAFGYNWYVFNIADVAIVAGVAGLLYDSIFSGPKSASKPSQD